VTTDCQPRTKKWPAGPQNNRGREAELDPVRELLVDEAVPADEVRSHLQRHDRRAERKADPEAPAHVGELGIGAGVGGRDLGLQRHAADRAGSRGRPAGSPGASGSVDRALRHGLGRRRVLGEVFLRGGRELGAASGGAEIVGATLVRVLVLRAMRIDRHAADRIEHAGRGGGLRMPAGGMIVVPKAVPGLLIHRANCSLDTITP